MPSPLLSPPGVTPAGATGAPLRVLMLAQFFRPIIGGEERAVEDLSGALAARGHDIAVATLRIPGTEAREERGGVRVHRLDGLVGRLDRFFAESDRRHLPPLPDPELLAGLRRVLLEERPDVVHAHNWIVHSYLPLARRGGAPLVLSLHDYSLRCATKRLIRAGTVCEGPGAAKCLRCAADLYGLAKGTFVTGALRASAPSLDRAVDMYLPVSDAVADRLELRNRGLPFTVIPNLIPERQPETAVSDPDQERLLAALPEGDFLLFLGDATVDKGARVLLEAHALLDDPPPLVFIGRPIDIDGAARDGRVVTLGPWPHAAALQAVSRALLLVVPSIVPETFGIGALEAMSRGTPVVASRLGGLAELVVDGETGRTVAPGDPMVLAAAIRDLLADRTALAVLGRAAKQHASMYSAARVAPRVEQVYGALLDTRARREGRPRRGGD